MFCWRMSQACSIGLRSGERLSQSMRWIVSFSKYSFTIRSLWDRAFSSMKINSSQTTPAMVLTAGWRISSRYFKPVRYPLIKCKSILMSTLIQCLPKPLPSLLKNLSCLEMQQFLCTIAHCKRFLRCWNLNTGGTAGRQYLRSFTWSSLFLSVWVQIRLPIALWTSELSLITL